MTAPTWSDQLAGAHLLSLWQPWGSAIADGVKGIETRGYRTHYRGWLLIQAAQHVLTRAERSALPAEVLDYGLRRTLPRGAVVAVARLTEVLPVLAPDDPTGHEAHVTLCRHDPAGLLLARPGEPGSWSNSAGRGEYSRWATKRIDAELPWGGYWSGRFAWLLADVHRLDQPVPARGHQGGPRTADPLVTATVAAQLDHQQEPTP